MGLRLAFAGVSIALLTGLASAHAEEGNACAEFYDAAKGDRGAADVYVGVERADNEPACFLVPRVAIERGSRHLYSDGTVRLLFSDSNHFDLPFDPVDLRHYLGHATSIAVGSEMRAVETDKLGCLANPTPAMMAIMPGPASAPRTIATLSVRTEEATTDFPGYHRYSDQYGGNYYVVEAGRDTPISFWCAPEAWAGGVEVCGMAGEYERMATVIQYFKSDMLGVKPEKALECVRTLGNLFKVK